MRTPGAENWTEAEEATLARMWADGATGPVIAEALGGSKTRNSVITKARRMELPYRREKNSAGQRVHAKGEPFRPRRISVLTGLSALGERPADDRWSKGPAWQPLPGVEPVTLLDLEPGMCKWPIGDRPVRFCGAHADGVYCEHHRRISTGGQP